MVSYGWFWIVKIKIIETFFISEQNGSFFVYLQKTYVRLK